MATTVTVFFVQDFNEIRNFTGFDRTKAELVIRSSRDRYIFNSTSTQQDVGDGKSLRPVDIAPTDPGRWILIELWRAS